MRTVIESYQLGLWNKKNWSNNVIAGLIVGVVALPLAMAFAIASGAKPEQGLYTAIVAGLIVTLMGGSRVQIAGPTGAFVVILSGIHAKYGMDGLQLATLMAGGMLVFMGAMRLGGVIKFIPDPVILGFTAGIAFVIFVGQWSYFFGLPAPVAKHFHDKLWQLIQAIPSFHFNTTLLAIFSLLIVLYSNRIKGLGRIPTPLLALVAATLLQSFFHFEGVATIGNTFGGIPMGWPSFHAPELSLARVIELIGPAFTIAMLGAIESLLSAVVADGMAGTKHHSNRELIGQGLANIAVPFFGGFAATGAIARTATNIRNGANSPLAGIVHALTLLFIILFLAPLAENVPLCCLAAILFVVAWNMSEIGHIIKLMKRAPRADLVILAITFFLTIFVDLVVAVNIGVILAVLHFIKRMSTSLEVQALNEEAIRRELPHPVEDLPANTLVYSVDGPFFFGAAECFEQALEHIHQDPKVIIFQMRWVPFVDMTAIQTLEEIIQDFKARGICVILCGVKPRIESKLKKAGIHQLLSLKAFPKTLSEAFLLCKKMCMQNEESLVNR